MTNDQFRNYLTFFLAGSFVGIIPLFIFWGMPKTSENIVTYMVGQLSGMALMALGYYFSNSATKSQPVDVRVANKGNDPVKTEDTGGK